MKKILSLTLVVMLLISAIPTAFAAEAGGNWAGGTQVEATGSRSTVEDDGSVTHDVEYTITVPAKLAPAGSGTVTLEGMWPSDATVKVTADPSVEMVNSINSADKKTLAVTFTAIELAGNNTVAVSDDETVSVADISAALFGTWSGKFNYNVDYVAGSGNTGDSGTTVNPSDPDTGDGEAVLTEAGAAFSDGTILTWEELKLEENGTKYGYTASKITDTAIDIEAFESCQSLTSIMIPEGVTKIANYAFSQCKNLTEVTIPDSVGSIGIAAFLSTNLTTVNYTGTEEQWTTLQQYIGTSNSGLDNATINYNYVAE